MEEVKYVGLSANAKIDVAALIKNQLAESMKKNKEKENKDKE